MVRGGVCVVTGGSKAFEARLVLLGSQERRAIEAGIPSDHLILVQTEVLPSGAKLLRTRNRAMHRAVFRSPRVPGFEEGLFSVVDLVQNPPAVFVLPLRLR